MFFNNVGASPMFTITISSLAVVIEVPDGKTAGSMYIRDPGARLR